MSKGSTAGGEGGNNSSPAASDVRVQARILVIDDDPDLAAYLAELLEIQGHRVTISTSASHGLELLRRQIFDLVFTDFRMPEMSGRQFYESAIGEHPSLAGRVVFLTGDVANHDTHVFIKGTGNPFLTKPFQVDQLERLVKATLISDRPARPA